MTRKFQLKQHFAELKKGTHNLLKVNVEISLIGKGGYKTVGDHYLIKRVDEPDSSIFISEMIGSVTLDNHKPSDVETLHRNLCILDSRIIG